MGRREEGYAVAADGGVKRGAGIEDVGPVNLFGLYKAFHKAVIRRSELCLVQVVVNGLAGDSVTKTNLVMFLVVHISLASGVVERGWRTFVLQLRVAKVPHRGPAFQRHLRVGLFVYLRPLALYHRVFARNTPQARQKKVAYLCKCDRHRNLLLGRDAGCGVTCPVVALNNENLTGLCPAGCAVHKAARRGIALIGGDDTERESGCG